MKAHINSMCIVSAIVWLIVLEAFGLSENAADAQILLLIRNGSFESPGASGLFETIPDYWTVTNGASIANTVSTSYTQYLPATDGLQVLILYGASISQNVSLMSGQQYQLTLDLSPRQYDGSSPSDALLNFAISDGTQVLNNSFFVPAGTTNWTQESFLFTANDTDQYALSLTSPSLQPYMSVIDNVRLEVVPEPNIDVLFGSGILIIALLFKRKKFTPPKPPRPPRVFNLRFRE